MMKRKVLFLAMSALVSVGTFAQRVENVENAILEKQLKNDPVMDRSLPENQITPEEAKKLQEFRNYIRQVNNSNLKAGAVEGIVDFGAECDSAVGTGTLLEITGTGECFPDSSVLIHFSNADRNVRFHGFGATYDPQATMAYPWVFDRNNDAVVVDTIYWTGSYRRYRTFVDDTFHVEVVKGDLINSDPNFGRVQYAAGVFTNLLFTARATTPAYAGVTAHGFHLGLSGSNVLHEKVVLTNGDDSKVVWKIPVNMSLSPGEGLGVLISLEIGDGGYTAGETIDLVAETGPNFFRQFMWSNQFDTDDNTYFLHPYAYDDQNTTHGTSRMQTGSWLYVKTRYAEWTGSDAWRNDLVNPYAGSIANDIAFYVHGTSTSTVGAEKHVATGFNLDQNVPNPFTGASTIWYETKVNTKVRFEIYDITGKVVKTINEGEKSAGKYSVEINSNEFEGGVYYYTMFTDAGKLTRKMIVVN